MSSLTAVLPHLEREFANQRLVFWNDPEGEYTEDVRDMILDGVTVLLIDNNEYGAKHRILREDPDEKFLIYRGAAPTSDVSNWLLDLELAYGTFTADSVALLRQELGLGNVAVGDVLAHHRKFFRSAKRTQALKGLLRPEDDPEQVQAKMCAVLLGQNSHSLSDLTRTLLVENAADLSEKYEALVSFDLAEFYWDGVSQIYGYEAVSASIEDLVLWIFRQAVTGFGADSAQPLRNLQLDFANWRNDRRSAKPLKDLAKRAAHDLDYAAQIEDAAIASLLDHDLFEETEQKIVSELARLVSERTASAREVSEVIKRRQSSLWFDEYQDFYQAIGAASELLSRLVTETFEVSSFDEGLQRYRDDWFQIDQLYRQFRLALRSTADSSVLEGVPKEVENYYVNKFLSALGDSWQRQVDQVGVWRSLSLRSQSSFYRDHIRPLVGTGNKKAVVIISDALRYEIADELGRRIRQEDRFDADLDAMLGVVPSYTQLGMASLLPHKTLGHSPEGDPVLVDGQRSDGTANRNRILSAVDGHAIQAEDVLGMTSKELKQLYTQHRVFYIYHDRIDAKGDDVSTERQVFEAVEDALEELVKLVKKMASANATNIFVTADHGFLYQDSAVAESGYLSTPPHGDALLVKNRRYVMGRGLKEDPAFKTFTPDSVGLESDLELQIPKSTRRLRLAGGGSRYVHGGAALQEIIVPVLAVNKKRKSDVRQANVQVQPETNRITTGQLVVKLHQSEPVTDKVRPRVLRAGLFVGDDLISNQARIIFDEESADPRDRYRTATLFLDKNADAYNNRIAEFRLEEKIPNTSQWRVYQRVPYTLRRSFTTDFDF